MGRFHSSTSAYCPFLSTLPSLFCFEKNGHFYISQNFLFQFFYPQGKQSENLFLAGNELVGASKSLSRIFFFPLPKQPEEEETNPERFRRKHHQIRGETRAHDGLRQRVVQRV